METFLQKNMLVTHQVKAITSAAFVEDRFQGFVEFLDIDESLEVAIDFGASRLNKKAMSELNILRLH